MITAFGVPPWLQLILQVASPWLPLSSNGFWQLQAPSSGESYFAISASICSAQERGFFRFGWPAILEFYKDIAIILALIKFPMLKFDLQDVGWDSGIPLSLSNFLEDILQATSFKMPSPSNLGL